MTVPDDVVELAARETYEKATEMRWATLGDSRRNVWLGVMRHVLSLPEVRAALAPTPTPRVSQAERLAERHHALWREQRPTGITPWEDCIEAFRAEKVAAMQVLIDDGTIPAEPEPDVGEMFSEAYYLAANGNCAATRYHGLIALGWTIIPPQDGGA